MVPAQRNRRPYLIYACFFILHSTEETHSTLPSPNSFPLRDTFLNNSVISALRMVIQGLQSPVLNRLPVKGLTKVRFNLIFCQKAFSTMKCGCAKSARSARPMSHSSSLPYHGTHSSPPKGVLHEKKEV